MLLKFKKTNQHALANQIRKKKNEVFKTDMHLAVCQHGANDTQESIEEEAHSTHDILLECKCCKNAEMLRIMSRSQVGRKDEKDKKDNCPIKKKLRILQEGGKGTKLHETTA